MSKLFLLFAIAITMMACEPSRKYPIVEFYDGSMPRVMITKDMRKFVNKGDTIVVQVTLSIEEGKEVQEVYAFYGRYKGFVPKDFVDSDSFRLIYMKAVMLE